jgi:hypothetical protein
MNTIKYCIVQNNTILNTSPTTVQITNFKESKADILKVSEDTYIGYTTIFEQLLQTNTSMNTTMTVKNLINSCKNKLNDLIELFKQVATILNENNIIFILSCGTLLGYCRNKQIIPYDDDIDIEIFEEDAHKLDTIDWKNLTYCGWSKQAQLYLVKNDKVSIDIFSSRNKKESILNRTIDFPGTKSVIPLDYIFPLVKSTFYDVDIYLPNDAEGVCMKLYGNDAINNCYVWNHGFNDKWTRNYDKHKIVLPLDIVNLIETISILDTTVY